MGIANIIGAGLFVLSGVAAGLAGPSVILSFVIAGGAALLTALSTAELSSFITDTGASYAYTKRAFGTFWCFLVGWFKYFDYTVGAAAVAIGFASYFTRLTGWTGDIPLLATAVALPAAVTVLNLVGVKETTVATSGLVIFKLIALLVLIAGGAHFMFGNFDIGRFQPFFPNGGGGTLHGAAVIFFAFIGFNTIAMMSEETEDPARTIPRALLLAFGVCFAFYCAIAVLEVGTMDWQKLGSSASPLEDVADAVFKQKAFIVFINISALAATASVVLSSVTAGTRAGFAMGRDGLLPRQLDRVSERSGTPYVSIAVNGVLVTVLAGAFYRNIDLIASIFNFGSLFTYLFVQLSLMRLRRTEPDVKRPFRVPLYPAVPILGVVSCLLLMLYLSNTAKVASLVWLGVGLLTHFWLRRHNSTAPLQ